MTVDAPDGGSAAAENSTDSFFYTRFFDHLKVRLDYRYHQGPTMSEWQVWQLQMQDAKSDVSNGASGNELRAL